MSGCTLFAPSSQFFCVAISSLMMFCVNIFIEEKLLVRKVQYLSRLNIISLYLSLKIYSVFCLPKMRN